MITTLVTGLGWLVLLPVVFWIARAEFRGEGVFRYDEDDE